MGDTLRKEVELYQYGEYTNTKEINLVKLAQTNLKKTQDTELHQKILKSAIKAYAESKHAVFDIARLFNEWVIPEKDSDLSHINNCHGEDMNKYKYEWSYLQKLKLNDDFIKGFIFEEDENTVAIVIQNSSFACNKIYLKSAREFKKQNKCEFNILIFDERQLDDFNKYLDSIDYCEVDK